MRKEYTPREKVYILTDTEEFAIRNYICGNIRTLAGLARVLETDRQKAVNLIANVLPYWYKVGKLDLGEDYHGEAQIK